MASPCAGLERVPFYSSELNLQLPNLAQVDYFNLGDSDSDCLLSILVSSNFDAGRGYKIINV
jgi:hypothetical protein